MPVTTLEPKIALIIVDLTVTKRIWGAFRATGLKQQLKELGVAQGLFMAHIFGRCHGGLNPGDEAGAQA